MCKKEKIGFDVIFNLVATWRELVKLERRTQNQGKWKSTLELKQETVLFDFILMSTKFIQGWSSRQRTSNDDCSQGALPEQFPSLTVTLSMAMSLVYDHPLIPSNVS